LWFLGPSLNASYQDEIVRKILIKKLIKKATKTMEIKFDRKKTQG
jgi:hypothetical protein